MIMRATLFALMALLAIPLSAGAVPVQWEGNGHWYEYLPELVTWEQAQIVAESLTWQGEPGYLVTLTNAAETTSCTSRFWAATLRLPRAIPGSGAIRTRPTAIP